jgi:hypothetical protein
MTVSVGIEMETSGLAIRSAKRELDNAGIQGVECKPDGTPNVDCEIVLPPLAMDLEQPRTSQPAFQYLQRICNVIDMAGATVNTACGLHVHVSNAPLADNTHAARYTGDSILHKERTGRYLNAPCLYGEPFDAAIVKDIMLRYTEQCYTLSPERIAAADTISDLSGATHGKFSSINLETWSRGTIEFRQHSGTIDAVKIWNWCHFLVNLVKWTCDQRIEHGSRAIVTETPVSPFRANSRVGVQYAMMRAIDGASTRDIMNATGCSEQRVRAAVSEIRARVGDAAVVTHTQQANGGRYGDGTDLTRYEVLQAFETQSTGATLMPENRRGMPSIWAGLSDDLFEFWQDRIISLR